MLICIIQRIIFLVGPEELGADSFFHWIPDFDCYKEFPASAQRKELTPEAEVADFTVNLLILNKGPNLTIYHAVKLSNQNHVIAILPMLREERKPFLPAFSIPFPSIKHKLALVDHQEQAAFTEWMVRKIMPGEGNKHCRR